MAIAGVMFGVGNHYDGGALFVEVCQELHYFVTVGGVEVTGRFIGEDELGVIDDGAGNCDTLLLTTRELLWVVVTAVHDLHFIQYDFHALFSFRSFYTEVDEGKLYVFEYGQLIDQVEALEYETDISFTEVGAFAFVKVSHFGTIEQKASAIGIIQQTEDIQEGGFAAARGSHDGDKFAFFYLKAEPVQCDSFHFFRAVSFLEFTDLDHNISCLGDVCI